MGNQVMTRAGKTGSLNTDALKGSDAGFGVFAYYTGTGTYTSVNGNLKTGTPSAKPNFMYNEPIKWDGSKWWYVSGRPVKYWPNEVQSGAVDDQTPAAATTDYTNGGNISFFAYAPYVASPISSTTGITAFTANDFAGDPKVTYVIDKDGQVVDLLWGTYSGTTQNVVATGTNNGVVSTDATADPGLLYPKKDRTTYAEDILKGYTTNADLTKQKTEGKVGFLFKHALAKVGGSEIYTGGGGGVRHGLMIQLDLDKADGSETGGTKQDATIVTVESIKIKAGEVEYDSDEDGDIDGSDTKAYVTGGQFNLATGKWGSLTTGTAADAITHTITTTASASGSDAVLNHTIAEPDASTIFGFYGGNLSAKIGGTAMTDIAGVLTTRKNVYESEANPLVFIPGTKPSFEVEITYYVRTFDDELAAQTGDFTTPATGTWTKVKQTIKKTISFNDPVQLNKQYNILIRLGLTSVKFEASVSNWDIETGTNNIDTDGDGTNDAVGHEVYVPINVQ